MIKKFTKKFGNVELFYTKINNSYYLVNKDLIKLSKKIKYKPESIGLFLGKEENGRFTPSLALLEILSKKSKDKIYVKDIGEIDFLYGKDLRERHIIKIEGEIKDGFLKFVQNEYDENLGLGKIKIKNGKIKIRNKIDRGDFLRRER